MLFTIVIFLTLFSGCLNLDLKIQLKEFIDLGTKYMLSLVCLAEDEEDASDLVWKKKLTKQKGRVS